jgi:Cys-tRNA(Pro)/Cys-tRNA(Cys) deacylase
MTPAIAQVIKERVPHTIHQYQHRPGKTDYGQEAVEKLGFDPRRVFKTLVVQLDQSRLAVAVLPVAAMLSMKQLARAAGARKASMAEPAIVTKTTGYILGGVSPLGQKKLLATWIDASAEAFATIYISAGRRGLELEIRPTDLARLTDATFTPLCTTD